MALGLLLAGCSSSADTSSDPAAAVAGSWTFTSGSIDPMCDTSALGGTTIPPFDLTGDTLTINRVTSTQVSTALNGTGFMCDVNFSVSGSTATASPNQTCVFTVSIGGSNQPVTVDVSSWVLKVSGDTLSMTFSGTA
ncbi:MAG TPA: hypothetical protein VHO06_02330, partial [Polyangia bacterium]|nr:hypothetical protein [Polyangia bacterium]